MSVFPRSTVKSNVEIRPACAQRGRSMVWASLCAVWWFMKLGESFTFVSPPLASSARHTESRTRSLGVSTRSVRHRGRSGAQVLSLSWEALSLDHGGEGARGCGGDCSRVHLSTPFAPQETEANREDASLWRRALSL